MTDPVFTPTRLMSPTGADLALYHLPAAWPARGSVQIHHGLAEHACRYAEFAAFLAARGYHVYAHDHRGHGATTAPDAPPRLFAEEDGWAAVMADAEAVNAHIHAAHARLPVIAFGHSMGGIIAFNQLLRAPETLTGAAVWNSNLALGPLTAAMRAVLALEGLFTDRAAPSRLMNALTFETWNREFKPNHTEFDWLSHDEARVDAYVRDPLCGWPASISLWRDFVSGMEYGEDSDHWSASAKLQPLQLVGGREDPATRHGRGVEMLSRRLKAAGFTDIDTVICPEMRHETLNEQKRETAYALFADWADRVTAARRDA